jgi:hypothetical protein
MLPWVRLWTIAVLCCLLCLTTLVAVGQSTLVVDPDNPKAFRTIQSAIDVAGEHDRIVIHAATYVENLRIDHTVVLISFGEVTLVPVDDTAPAVAVTGASDVLIRGLAIEEAGTGIELLNSSGSISGCTFRHCEVGVKVISLRGPAIVLSGLDFRGEDAGIGLEIVGQGEIMVFGCSFSDLATGMVVGGQAGVLAEQCAIEHCFDGLSALSTASLTLVDCDIRSNHASGIVVHTGPGPEACGSLLLLDNRIDNNGSWGINACDLQSTDGSIDAFRVFAAANSFAGNHLGETCPENLLPD